MMNIDTNSIVTATEANQNFSRVARLAEKRGKVVIFKNNRPKLLVIDLDTEPQIEMSEDEKLLSLGGKSRLTTIHRRNSITSVSELSRCGLTSQPFISDKEEAGIHCRKDN